VVTVTPRKEVIDLNAAILGVTALTRGEAVTVDDVAGSIGVAHNAGERLPHLRHIGWAFV
jgi:hypothetical protein